MAKISAGEDFGQVVAQPMRLNEVAMPRAAFASGDLLISEGERLQREGEREIHEMRVQRDAADRAMATSALGTGRDGLADLVGELDAGILDGTVQKNDAGQVWQQRSEEVIQQVLGQVPEAHREIVQRDLRAQITRLTSKVAQSVRKRDQQDTRTSLNDIIEQGQRRYVTDPAGAEALVMSSLDNLGPAAGLSPDAIGKAKQAFREGAAYTRANALLLDARDDNKALTALEKQVQADQALDPNRKTELLGKIEHFRAQNEASAIRRQQRGLIEQERRLRQAEHAMNAVQALADAGKVIDPTFGAQAVAAATGTPYEAAVRELIKSVPERTAFAVQPLAVQRAQLDAIEAKANTTGTTDAELKRLAKLKAMHNAKTAAYADDPMRAAMQFGDITQLAPIDTRDFPSMVASMLPRVQQAQAVEAVAGRPVSPFTGEEAGRLTTWLSSMPANTKAGALAQLTQALGPRMASAVAAQIDAKDRPLALAMGLGTSQTTRGLFTGELVLRGGQGLKDKTVKEDTAFETSFRRRINEVVGESLPPKWRADVVDAARFIMLGKQAGGEYIEPEAAVRLALGGDLVEHNGRKVPVPVGVNLPRALATIPPAQIERQAPDNVVHVPGGHRMSVLDFVARLPEAQLEPVGPGRFAVRSGGGLVMNSRAQPIVVEVK